MSDYPYIIATEAEATPRRFPVVTQLAVLVGLLILVFSAVWVQTSPATTDTLTPRTTLANGDITSPTPLTPLPYLKEVSLTATAAYVWDVRGQRTLYSKNPSEPLPLASLTKLMTTLVAYELLDADTKATVSLEAIKQSGSSGFTAGEAFSLMNLSKLALITSSNDAAYALGAAVGQALGTDDPIAQFIAAMNIRSEELGLSSLQFFNTTGLDESATQAGATGSARDVSFLLEYMLTNYPELLTPTREEFTQVYNEEGSYHSALNTNHIVTDIPTILASKTGYTDLAGGNLTLAYDAGFDRPVIITVLGSTREERFSDVLTLITELSTKTALEAPL